MRPWQPIWALRKWPLIQVLAVYLVGGVVTFQGHGVMTYDSNEARYVLHWFDSMGSPPEVFTGTFEGDVLTVGHGGPGMHARLTYDLTRKGVLRSRMDLSEDGADWAGFFECDYERDS